MMNSVVRENRQSEWWIVFFGNNLKPIYFYSTYFFCSGPVSGTLHIQQIVVPGQVMTGSNVVLRCLFTDTDSSSTLPTSNHREALTDYDHIAGGPLYSLKVSVNPSVKSCSRILKIVYFWSGTKDRTNSTGTFQGRIHQQKFFIGLSLT